MGEVLWEKELPSRSYATALTYFYLKIYSDNEYSAVLSNNVLSHFFKIYLFIFFFCTFPLSPTVGWNILQ